MSNRAKRNEKEKALSWDTTLFFASLIAVTAAP